MARTIERKPEHEILLRDAVLHSRFQSLEQALDQALHPFAVTRGLVSTPTARAAAYRAWAESHPRTTPVLSDEAISRETIYANRRQM